MAPNMNVVGWDAFVDLGDGLGREDHKILGEGPDPCPRRHGALAVGERRHELSVEEVVEQQGCSFELDVEGRVASGLPEAPQSSREDPKTPAGKGTRRIPSSLPDGKICPTNKC